MNVLFYTAKGLSKCDGVKEINLDNPGVIITVLIREKGRQQNQSDVVVERPNWPLLALKMEGSRKPRNVGTL